MQIAYYFDAIFHILGNSDQDGVTFPKAHCLKPEKASHKEIWATNPSTRQTNEKHTSS